MLNSGFLLLKELEQNLACSYQPQKKNWTLLDGMN